MFETQAEALLRARREDRRPQPLDDRMRVVQRAHAVAHKAGAVGHRDHFAKIWRVAATFAK